MTCLRCQAEYALTSCCALPGSAGVFEKAHTPWLAIAALRSCVTWHLPRLNTIPCWCLQGRACANTPVGTGQFPMQNPATAAAATSFHGDRNKHFNITQFTTSSWKQ